MISIIIGIFMLIGGLSGKLVFRGTNSSAVLVVVSIIVIIRGFYQMNQNKKNQESADASYYMKSDDTSGNSSSFSNINIQNNTQSKQCPNCGAAGDENTSCKHCGTQIKS